MAVVTDPSSLLVVCRQRLETRRDLASLTTRLRYVTGRLLLRGEG